ncbi:hypothetical protein H6P81_004898 [Aristolochia fimbriata]|uniref:XS domain-containing protein n=1 Tax=Aristolochia fimbriata TaxID=158543 RepID=A0AAV7ETM1_ARIFI|nr:hypothetical protein H6P81_004898 [Aristolochia fimbriata]
MKPQNQKTPSTSKGSSHKHSSSSSAPHRKSRWETGNHSSEKPGSKSSSKRFDEAAGSAPPAVPSTVAPPLAPIPLPKSAAAAPFPLPDIPPPPVPPPAYGFHNLERRTIVLADGSVRSYFALPPDEYPPVRPLSDVAPGEKFLPFGPGPDRPFDPHYPPTVRMSPDGFRREIDHRDRGTGEHDYWASLGLDGRGPPDSSLKRKYGDEERDRERQRDPRDDMMRERHHFSHHGHNGFPMVPDGHRLEYGGGGPSSPFRRREEDFRSSKHVKVADDSYSRRGFPRDEFNSKHADVDPLAIKRAFLRFTKSLNESASQRKSYLEDGKYSPLQCLACGRSSKDYKDVHALVMHAYNSSDAASRSDHLGLHKALCVLKGWNYSRAPDSSKAYQSLPIDEATASKEDLIIWPPVVIVHNTNLGRGKDGRMEGMGNKEMDTKLRDLGFGGGKSKSIYGKEGHLGITVVKFANNLDGLKEAELLVEYFERDNHGRKGWTRAQSSSQSAEDDEKNPYLVKLDEKTREKKRILYGYLGTASDLDKVDFDVKKKAIIKSRKQLDLSD